MRDLYFCIRYYTGWRKPFEINKWDIAIPLTKNSSLFIGFFHSDFPLDFYLKVAY